MSVILVVCICLIVVGLEIYHQNQIKVIYQLKFEAGVLSAIMTEKDTKGKSPQERVKVAKDYYDGLKV